MHTCQMLVYATDNDYLIVPLQLFEGGVRSLNPAIPGPRVTKTGKKTRPSLMVNYCPFCGEKMADVPADIFTEKLEVDDNERSRPKR